MTSHLLTCPQTVKTQIYKDTVRFADEYYDSEEYFEEPTYEEKAENSDIIKKLKEDFREVHSSSLPTSFSWLLFLICNVFKYFYRS